MSTVLELGALKVGVVNDKNSDDTSSYRYEDISGNAFKTTEEVLIGINNRDGVVYNKDEVFIMARSFTYQFSKTTYIKQLLIEEPNLGITKEVIGYDDVTLVTAAETEIISMVWDAEYGDITNGTARLSFILNNPNNQTGTLELKTYVDGVEYSVGVVEYIANENSKQHFYKDVETIVIAGATIVVKATSSRDITLDAPIYFSVTKTQGV